MAGVLGARSSPLPPQRTSTGGALAKAPVGPQGCGEAPSLCKAPREAEASSALEHAARGPFPLPSARTSRVSLKQRCQGKHIRLRGRVVSPQVWYLLTCQRA